MLNNRQDFSNIKFHQINYTSYSKTNYMHQCIKFIYFRMTLYMFQTVFPSIIRSSRLYVQQPNSSISLTNACCCMYSLQFLMMDGKTSETCRVPF